MNLDLDLTLDFDRLYDLYRDWRADYIADIQVRYPGETTWLETNDIPWWSIYRHPIEGFYFNISYPRDLAYEDLQEFIHATGSWCLFLDCNYDIPSLSETLDLPENTNFVMFEPEVKKELTDTINKRLASIVNDEF